MCAKLRCAILMRMVIFLTLPEIAGAIEIDFEALSNNESVYSQYDHMGVIFSNEPRAIEPEVGTHSGTRAISNNDPGEEFDPGPLVINFSTGQSSVSMFVGIDYSTNGNRIPAHLNAYDAQGRLVDSKYLRIGPGPKAISEQMTVSAENRNIRKVELLYDYSHAETIDDLYFNSYGPPTMSDNSPPIVRINVPANGAHLNFFEDNGACPFMGTVYEDVRLKNLSITVNNEEPRPFDFWGSGPEYEFGSQYTYGIIRDGRNTITVTAEDYAGNVGYDYIEIWYEPILSDAELLILTPEMFRQPLIALRDWKNATGISCAIMSLETINCYAGFDGKDIQEKIKKIIAYAFENRNTRYVMLVGDGDAFPVRYTRAGHRGLSWGVTWSASELYYADLFRDDGTFDDWDGNGNGVCGEWASLTPDSQSVTAFDQINVDQCDLHPDIAIGRIPASSQWEVANYVAKVLEYENPANQNLWCYNALLWNDPEFLYNELEHLQWIANNTLEGFRFIKQYRPPGWPFMTEEDRHDEHVEWEQRIVDYLSEGTGFAIGFGHGNRCCQIAALGVGAYTNVENQGRWPVFLASTCDAGKFIQEWDWYMDVNGNFPPRPRSQHDGWHDPRPEPAPIQPDSVDVECWAERLLVQDMNGAVGFIGSHSGVNIGTHHLCRHFTEARDVGFNRLGDMWNHALMQYIDNYLVTNSAYGRSSYYSHYIHKYVVFGDPSLRICGIREFEPRHVVTDSIIAINIPRLNELARRNTRIFSNLTATQFGTNGKARFTGKARAGRRLGFYEQGQLLKESVVPPSGAFDIELTGLEDGNHNIAVKPISKGEYSTWEKTVAVIIQSEEPKLLDLESSPSDSPGDFQLIGKTQDDGTWVELIEQDNIVATGYSEHGGWFTISPTDSLKIGRHNLTLKLRNAAGIESEYKETVIIEVNKDSSKDVMLKKMR